jgi:NAD(P)-dependent dehydrogenase (short-subunit alcohol dehydrogenase family)
MDSNLDKRVVLVTGANRGIGLEVCRQMGKLGYQVILTSRDEEKGGTACQALAAQGMAVNFCPLNVSSEDSIQAARDFVLKNYGQLDVLINNAAVFLDHESSILNISMDILKKTMETNTYGALRICQVFLPMMEEKKYGRIVNVSSQLGQHARMHPNWSAYRLSKLALNGITQMLAEAIRTPNVLVNCCQPGHVRTEMGGSSAPLSVEEGADTIVWLATLPKNGPNGKFFSKRRRLDW